MVRRQIFPAVSENIKVTGRFYLGYSASIRTFSKMCEWLSMGEWSDVQLLCGGRSFSAHRVVLASVSTFLRRILLTIPDEATTFIVLPDFDLEAMSSVLYYIYNGEVVLQKNKLGLFLEIIHAMQIYIDSHYLTEICARIQDIEEKYIEFAKYYENLSLPSQIFNLGLNIDNEQMFNIKKCKEMQRSLVKYSQSNFDFHDSKVRYLNESEVDESRLGNLKSPYEDRQRSTLLRDLFIETYPRNGNVNGLTESVLAISNECYQSPASELLANANRHLSSRGARAACPITASCHSLQSATISGDDKLQRTYNSSSECSKPIGAVDFLANRYSADFQNVLRFYSDNKTFLGVNMHALDDTAHTISGSVSKLLLDPIQYRINTENFIKQSNLPEDNESVQKKGISKSKAPSKVIFNQVLESPWNARKPNNYRPFRKKEEHLASSSTNKDQAIEIQNDTNNNVEIPATVLDGELADRELDQPLQAFVISPPAIECFKCNNCDQVFTTSESLAIHMRRHSSGARYACGECGKTFSQLRNFKYHMSIHRGTREFAATCSVCGKYFNDRGYLSSHMKIHRNRKEYKCSLCPKSFNQRVAYNMHVRIHTGVKPHVCEECGKAFSRKMLLKQHQRTHSGERPYACPHCDKCFADRSNMTLHVRLHTGVKPFSCPMCPKSFTKKHHLKSHLNFHTGSKPYSCPRCHLAFTQSSNMRTHYKKCNAAPSTSEHVPQ